MPNIEGVNNSAEICMLTCLLSGLFTETCSPEDSLITTYISVSGGESLTIYQLCTLPGCDQGIHSHFQLCRN